MTHIDFDIEGAGIAYTAGNALRFQAINALEAANSGLVVSVTIPVLPSGLDANGQAFLAAAKTAGTRIDVINVMTMDYPGYLAGPGYLALRARCGARLNNQPATIRRITSITP